MNILQILSQLLVNGITFFLLLNIFINIDLLKTTQIFIISSILLNVYLINKKVLFNKKCKFSYKQLGISVSISLINLFILSSFKTLMDFLFS